jgi:hypothetical protein
VPWPSPAQPAAAAPNLATDPAVAAAAPGPRLTAAVVPAAAAAPLPAAPAQQAGAAGRPLGPSSASSADPVEKLDAKRPASEGDSANDGSASDAGSSDSARHKAKKARTSATGDSLDVFLYNLSCTVFLLYHPPVLHAFLASCVALLLDDMGFGLCS